MILRIFFAICVIFVSPSLGKMTMADFSRKFEDMCFQIEPVDPFRVNGQDTPLSNTLENFIALAEKFEAANPYLNLKEELAYFLSGYNFENIKIINGRIGEWVVGRANFDYIDAMWDPDVNGYKPTYNEPFSHDEKCNLFHMISHSIIQRDTLPLRSGPYSPGNYSSKPARTEEQNPDDYFPQEMGVVAIQGTDEAVSLSKVLIGLFVGLNPNRMSDVTSYERIKELDVPTEELPQDKIVDALYAVTLADVLMRSGWISSGRQGLAPNGKWVSIAIDSEKKIDGFCPMVYKQEESNGFLPAYSYSSVKGAADGLILGLAAHDLYMKKYYTKLSQILRMYYNPDGITMDFLVDEINSKHISFCNRQSAIKILEPKLLNQMKLYGYLIAVNLKDVDRGYEKAKTLYGVEKSSIFKISNSELRHFCDRPSSVENPEDLPQETNLDVIVVMDSSNSKNSFQEQQMITGYLAKNLDLRYTDSKMTILLDQRIYSESDNIKLKPVVLDTYSSSYAACYAGQMEYEPSTVERDDVIAGIDQFLQEREKNETKLHGVNGKVVVYFNYENSDGRKNNKAQGRLEKALRDLYFRHQDIVFYAVGLDSELLKKYVNNDPSSVFLATDGTYEDVAKTIFNKISVAPALLQCPDRTNEKTVNKEIYYENIVSPYTFQHYEMPARYFYKSSKLSFKFQSQNGKIRVCHSRASARPEFEMRNCKDTSGSNAVEFNMSNPCKGFSKETCSPFYFSVMGMYSNEGEMTSVPRPKEYCNDLNDKWCATLDQVIFRVSHIGIC